MGRAKFLLQVSRHAPTHKALDWLDAMSVVCVTLEKPRIEPDAGALEFERRLAEAKDVS